MNYEYRRFDDYEAFAKFLRRVSRAIPAMRDDYETFGWKLHSWQDVGGMDGIDIRAIFVADGRHRDLPNA